MKTELKNIEIAKKMLEHAMAALDNKFFVLSNNDAEITLDQAIAIMENYDVVNELRNVIANQYNQLFEKSKKDHALLQELLKIYNEWLSEYFFKINGIKGEPETPEKNLQSYFNKMHRIKDFFEVKIKNASEADLLSIRNGVELGRKSGGSLSGQYQTISRLFNTTYEQLLKKLPEHERKITATGILRKVSLIRSAHELASPTTSSSSVQLNKEQIKLESVNLKKEMLLFALDKSDAIARNLKERMQWIDNIFQLYSDEGYEDDLEKGIVFAIEQLLDPIKSKNLSILDKIQLLDKLVANNTKNSKAVLEAYHYANQQLTQELANQVIDEDRNLFRALVVEDYIKEYDKNKQAKQMAQYFNRVSYQFADLLLHENINMRILMTERLIRLAQLCYEQGDFNGAICILSMFEMTAIFRMKNTMNSISSEASSVLEYLKIKLNAEPKNFPNLKSEMAEINGQVVPYLGNFTKDFIYGYEDLKNYHNVSIFEIDKGLHAITPLIAIKQKFEQYDNSSLSTRRDFVNIVNSPNYPSVEDLEKKVLKRSTSYEPKDKETNKLITLQSTVDPKLRIKWVVPKLRKKNDEADLNEQDKTKLFLNENPELLTKFDELIARHGVLLHSKYLDKSKSDSAQLDSYLSLYERLDNMFAEIDKYIDQTLRSALSKPLDSMVITTISYIIDKRYTYFIALCDEDKQDAEKQALKKILLEERTRFSTFIHELNNISSNYLESFEQNKTRKEANYAKQKKLRKEEETLSSASTNESQATRLSTESDSTNISILDLESAVELGPEQQQQLPLDELGHILEVISNLKANISITKDELELSKDEYELLIEERSINEKITEQDIELQKLKIKSLQLKLDETQQELLKSEQKLKTLQKHYMDQILHIVESHEPINEMQAMVIICNFSAILTGNQSQAVENLKLFDQRMMDKIVDKLDVFKSDLRSGFSIKLQEHISSLNMFIGFSQHELIEDTKDQFEQFNNLYKSSKKSMAENKELFKYYKILDNSITADSVEADIILPLQTSESAPSLPTLVSAPQQEKKLPVASELRKSFDYHPAADEIQSQPARTIPLLDVDNTLVMGSDNYNDELINALIEQRLTQVYLFTSYSSHGAANKDNKDNKGSRDKLIKYLASKNIHVLGVIVEDDVLYKRGVGEWYKDKLQPLEIAAANNTLQKVNQNQVADLEMELRMGISIADYEHLSAEEKKIAEQRARVNSPDKGDMFKYVVSQLGSQHNYIFIDDDFTKNIPQVRKSANELSTKLITITATKQKKKQQYLEEMKEYLIIEYEKHSSDNEKSLFFEKMMEQFLEKVPHVAFKDLMIWVTNRKELYRLIEQQNFDEFNNTLTDLQLSEEGRLQIVEIMFEAIKNNNINGKAIKDYTLQKNMAIPLANYTLDPMLPSHYDLLKKYKVAVLDQYPNNKYHNFALPANHAARRFLEDHVDKYINISHENLNVSVQNLNEFIELIHQSTLTPSQRLQIYEILFTFIKENKLRDSQGNEITDSGDEIKTIYKLLPDENLPLLTDFLSAHRKPLLKNQIELIKILKGAYVDTVQDAQDKLTSIEEKAAVNKMVQNKNSLVDFQNSNTPIDVAVTGTRKKLNQILSLPPQLTEGDRLLKEEIAELQLHDLNKIVDKILDAQDRNDTAKLEQYVEKYLGRRKYGILTRNYREEFIRVAIENGNAESLNTNNNRVEPSNPLLRLAKNAGPELKKAIITSEILDSHFWKGHISSKKYVSEVLHKGRLTLEDFRRYRDTFATKQEAELKIIEERNRLLVDAISHINSKAIKDFMLQQIGQIKIEFLESNEFNNFLINFVKPMVNALNQNYKENDFPDNFNDFYHVFYRDVQITAEKNKLLTKKFTENFNQVMAQHKKVNELEDHVPLINEMSFVDIHSRIEELKRNIIATYNTVKGHAHSDNPTDKSIFNNGSVELSGYHRMFEQLEKTLNRYKQKLEEVNRVLDKLTLTPMQSEKLKDLLDEKNGVKAKLALITHYSQQMKDVKKESLDPLQFLYSPQDKSLKSSIIKAITPLPKSSHK